MKFIQIYIEGSGWHDLPADTPPETINEYVACAQSLLPPPVPKSNGKGTRTEGMEALKYLAGEL